MLVSTDDLTSGFEDLLKKRDSAGFNEKCAKTLKECHDKAHGALTGDGDASVKTSADAYLEAVDSSGKTECGELFNLNVDEPDTAYSAGKVDALLKKSCKSMDDVVTDANEKCVCH